jgi:hypothetical protein
MSIDESLENLRTSIERGAENSKNALMAEGLGLNVGR